MAGALALSRGAVWKAIEELRKEGYAIDAVTNRGYSLSDSSDLLSAEGILLHLKDLPVNREQIHIYKTVDSTNQVAKKMAVAGAAHGSVFLAEEQTMGKGRRGRSFFSPKGTGLYMSVLLRPTGTSEQAVLTTTAAAVAVCRALSRVLGVDPSIKWVNDVFVDGRKVCGILTEAVSDFESGSIEFLVLGIGINVSTADFPDELRQVAGAVLANGHAPFSRNVLAAAVLREVLALTAEPDPAAFLDEYRRRCFVVGKPVTVHGINETYDATAVDIDAKGALIVEKPTGERFVLNSGEVSVRPRKK